MNEAAGVSLRSVLIAGVSAAIVGTAAVTPLQTPRPMPATVAATVELASITSGLDGLVNNLKEVAAGIDAIFTNLNAFVDGVESTVNHVLSIPGNIQASIKTTYDTAERWPAYAAAWAQFSLGLVPGLWWVAPSVPLAYNTAEPLVQAGVYSVADVVGLDPIQFVRDISTGIKTSSENAATYRKAWVDSLVAVPTLPPYPGPLPGSPANAEQVPAAAATAKGTGAPASAATSGIENAIKNTYNALEPWAAWGAELIQWGMSFVPGLWWLAPGVSLAYFSIEPLVQAGVFSVADVLGLNFSQIGPDITSGIKQSAQNFVNYGLAWLQSLIPFPPLPPFPPRPFAAVTGPTAAVSAAAAISATEATTAGFAPAPTGDNPAAADTRAEASAADTDLATTADKTAPAVDPAPATRATPTTDAAATDSGGQPTETASAAVTDPESPAVEQSPPAGEAPRPSRGTHLGHRNPAAGNAARKSGVSDNADTSTKTEHSGRSAQ